MGELEGKIIAESETRMVTARNASPAVHTGSPKLGAKSAGSARGSKGLTREARRMILATS